MKILLKLWWCWLSEMTDDGEGRWDGGSMVSWAGLLVVRQVEEGATNKDLDDDDDAMDVASDKDDAIVHATVGWHPSPPPLLAWWLGRGSCRATTTTGRPPLLLLPS